MTESTKSPLQTKEKLWRRLLFEFIVVFGGVYGAFVVSDYQEARRDKKAKLIYLETFKGDLLRLENSWRAHQSTLIDSIVAFYENEIKEGRRPELRIHRDVDFPENLFVIQSAFLPEHFGNLTKDHLININHGSNLISMIRKRMDIYQAECRRFLSGTHVDQAAFYNPGGSLKSSMQWYLDDLKYLQALLRNLQFSIMNGAVPATDFVIKQTLED